MFFRRVFTGLLILVCCFQVATAQAAREKSQKQTIPFKERWAFRSNAVNWVGLMPNIGVEYDLSSSVYNKWTLGISATWNGNTDVNFDQKIQQRINDYRIEARKHVKPSLQIRPGQKRMPKFWRTYYWGIYAGYTKFNLMWNKGVAGDLFQAGVTGGWEVPLYQCKQGGLDLDLGLSIGMLYAEYGKYRFADGKTVLTEQKGRHILPYPLPTEIRVGIVYRFNSIKYKYTKTKTKY